MLGIFFALTAALSWGTGDYLGGIASRRYPLLWVMLASAGGGMTLALVLSLGSGDPFPSGDDVVLAVAAGLAGLVALAAFYKALAIGTMSIVAPITATGAAIPVLWGVIGRGESLSSFTVVAMFVAIAGVILASREQDLAETTGVDAATHRRSVLLAIVAALGFGAIFTLIAEAGEHSIYWPAAILKCSTVVAVAVALLIARRGTGEQPARPSGNGWLFPISIGFFDVSANITFTAATHHGSLAVTSVVSSLYPVTTILLAYVFLHERLVKSQILGVFLALAGVAMISAATA